MRVWLANFSDSLLQIALGFLYLALALTAHRGSEGYRVAARCGTPGVPKIQPPELLKVGGPVTLAFLWCNSCIWEIDQAQLDKPSRYSAAAIAQRRAARQTLRELRALIASANDSKL